MWQASWPHKQLRGRKTAVDSRLGRKQQARMTSEYNLERPASGDLIPSVKSYLLEIPVFKIVPQAGEQTFTTLI